MNDSPLIEYDDNEVIAVFWHEGGVYLFFEGGGGVNVGEDAKVVCGMAVTPVMDLHLRFGYRVPAKFARFGEER